MKIQDFKIIAVLLAFLSLACPAAAQMTGQVVATPMGYCQLASLTSATRLSSCIRGSFTGTGAGTTLTAASATGYIKPLDFVTGTGVPPNTYIVAQLTGTPGGAGTYQTNQATTSSGASLTSGGVPLGANAISVRCETQAARYTDDNTVAPTASVGQLLNTSDPPMWYQGGLAGLQLIQVTTGAVCDVLFYKTP